MYFPLEARIFPIYTLKKCLNTSIFPYVVQPPDLYQETSACSLSPEPAAKSPEPVNSSRFSQCKYASQRDCSITIFKWLWDCGFAKENCAYKQEIWLFTWSIGKQWGCHKWISDCSIRQYYTCLHMQDKKDKKLASWRYINCAVDYAGCRVWVGNTGSYHTLLLFPVLSCNDSSCLNSASFLQKYFYSQHTVVQL